MGWFSSIIRNLRGVDELARKDYVEHLGKHFDPATVQLAIKNAGGLRAIAEPVLRKANGRFHYGVWCGAWPDSSYNVNVERTKNGAVMLVSTGFLQAVVDFAYLVMHQAKIDVPDAYTVKQLSPSAASNYLGMIIKAAQAPATRCVLPFNALPGTVYDQLSSMSGPRARMLNNVVVSTVRFAVAHEAAHICLGHLENPPHRIGPDRPDQLKKHGLTDSRRKMANTMFEWSDEMDADAEALRITLRLPNENWEEPYLGVCLFTELTDALLTSNGVSRYPHPLMRRSAAIGTVHPKSLGAQFPLCEPFIRSIEALRYGPWPPPDVKAFERVVAWGEEFDPKQLPPGEVVKGVRVLSGIPEFIAADFVRARACVAYLGISSRGVSRVVSGSKLLVFATCYDSFRRTYSKREDWAETDRLLRAVVTDLDWTLDLWQRSAMSD